MYALVTDVGPTRATIEEMSLDLRLLADNPLWDSDTALIVRLLLRSASVGDRVRLSQVRIIDDPNAELSCPHTD